MPELAALEDLLTSATTGDIQAVRRLLDSDPALATAVNMFGASAIHAAHFAGHQDIVALLRERGARWDGFTFAELNLVDDLRAVLERDPAFATSFNAGGSTPLHGACYWGALNTARLLIDRGADVRAVSRDSFLGIHPLGSAVATPDIANPAQSEDNVLAMANLLLDAGAEVNARRRDGMTALHTAGYRGHLNVIRRLIERGADPTIRANAGGPHSNHTPRDTALAQDQTQAAELLKSLGG